ncbi:thioesterase [Camelimonas fluminis]|uniref:PaaI family thioesterase n=1 Tax=Camelimonas fluminis TaxID=1576911 RepID=A0ABV7UEM1_9HYPH|nr:PaaI family thioesterase [Camelimonas fluminis]GHE51661.1 thioesterase [Camelimonas fluminis]
MDVLRNNPTQLSGLEQLRGLVAAGTPPPMMRTLSFAPTMVEPGKVVFEGSPGPETLNPIGSVHGGYAATLLDSACGAAVHTRLGAHQGFTTLELKVAYHHALTPASGPVKAEGVVVSMGARVTFAEAKLTDARGRVCASATSTLLVFDLKPVA